MKKRKKKYKSVITKRIWKAVRKLNAAFLVLALFSSVMAIRGTNAGFLDEETSEGNTLTAASLDARVSYMELFDVTGMIPGSQPDENMTFGNEGSLDFKYAIKYKNVGGDSELCDALLLTTQRNGTKVYDKQLLKNFDLTDFSGTPFSIAVFGNDNWNFKIELPADAGKDLESKTCQFNFDFSVWQTDFVDGTQGFTDEETEGTNIIRTGNWLNPGDVVINEIMWMGSEGHSSDEWVELKNMTSDSINIGGWKIEKAGPSGGTITIPSGKSIPASGYFLIANYGKTSSSSSLNVDADYVVNLSLGNDSNDNLILKTPANIVIDSAKGTLWPAGNNGTQKQSMERNDIPGDGLLVASWHTCVSGAANDGTYWDTADGNNFGTPGAPNLSPIVVNEFVSNPIGDDSAEKPNGEWAELYNISDKNIDVTGWYFKNSQDKKIVISGDNTDSGKTIVPGQGRLVVYFEKDFLDNDKDSLYLYNDMKTPKDDGDDVKEDIYVYKDAGVLPEGKSFARFPDGTGIWIDPEATPGEENKMADKELGGFRLLAYEKCFDEEKIKRNSKEEICAPEFLKYLGIIKELDDKKANLELIKEINDKIEKEKGAVIEKEREASESLENVEIEATGENAVEVDATAPNLTPDQILAPVPASTPVPSVAPETEPTAEISDSVDVIIVEKEPGKEKTESEAEKKKNKDENIPAKKEEDNNSTDSNNEQEK